MRLRCLRTKKIPIWCRNALENFFRIVRTVFEKYKKNSKMFFWSFRCFFCLCWSDLNQTILMPLHTRRTLIWCRIIEENFVWSVRTVLKKVKNVQNWLFCQFWPILGYVSEIPALWSWCHCTNWTQVYCGMILETFVRIADSFRENWKSLQLAVPWSP